MSRTKCPLFDAAVPSATAVVHWRRDFRRQDGLQPHRNRCTCQRLKNRPSCCHCVGPGNLPRETHPSRSRTILPLEKTSSKSVTTTENSARRTLRVLPPMSSCSWTPCGFRWRRTFTCPSSRSAPNPRTQLTAPFSTPTSAEPAPASSAAPPACSLRTASCNCLPLVAALPRSFTCSTKCLWEMPPLLRSSSLPSPLTAPIVRLCRCLWKCSWELVTVVRQCLSPEFAGWPLLASFSGHALMPGSWILGCSSMGWSSRCSESVRMLALVIWRIHFSNSTASFNTKKVRCQCSRKQSQSQGVQAHGR